MNHNESFPCCCWIGTLFPIFYYYKYSEYPWNMKNTVIYTVVDKHRVLAM